METIWNLVFPGIPISGINNSLSNGRDLWNLWRYVFCKGVPITLIADHLDNAGINTIAKNYLLESIRINIINQERTPLQMDVTAAMSSLNSHGKILFFLSLVIVYNRTVWIWAGNYISFTIAAGLIRLHMPGVKKSRV